MKKLILLGLVFMLGNFAQAQEDKLQVVATFSILGDVVQQVAGDHAEVKVIMPLGTDPHTFQARPQDVATLIQADVVFSNGIDFEESLLDVMSASADEIKQVVVSSCVPILGSAAHHHDDHEHEDDEDHKHEDGEDHEHASLCDAHAEEILAAVGPFPHYYEDSLGPLYALDCAALPDEEACDPHVWTDPHNVYWWILLIRDQLSQLDPANAQSYAENAAAYLAELDESTHELLEALEALPAEQKILVTNHNTFVYLAAVAEFDVVETIIEGSSTTAEPSAGEFAGLIRSIRESKAPAIFAENTVSSSLVDQLASETGLPVYLLYTDSLSAADGEAASYLDYIRYNYQTLLDALSGNPR